MDKPDFSIGWNSVQSGYNSHEKIVLALLAITERLDYLCDYLYEQSMREDQK